LLIVSALGYETLDLLVAELHLGVIPIHVFANLTVQLIVVIGLHVLAALTVERPHTLRLLSPRSPTELS
jgi:hypothetical protein